MGFLRPTRYAVEGVLLGPTFFDKRGVRSSPEELPEVYVSMQSHSCSCGFSYVCNYSKPVICPVCRFAVFLRR